MNSEVPIVKTIFFSNILKYHLQYHPAVQTSARRFLFFYLKKNLSSQHKLINASNEIKIISYDFEMYHRNRMRMLQKTGQLKIYYIPIAQLLIYRPII